MWKAVLSIFSKWQNCHAGSAVFSALCRQVMQLVLKNLKLCSFESTPYWQIKPYELQLWRKFGSHQFGVIQGYRRFHIFAQYMHVMLIIADNGMSGTAGHACG